MTGLAPVVLFVYNRPRHTRQTLDAIRGNPLASATHLYVFSDAARTESDVDAVDSVRGQVHGLDGFQQVTVIEREHNHGLARSIIEGVTQVLSMHDRVIVLEDDLVTSPVFLSFMNRGLDVYHDRQDILSITGFSFPTRFMGFTETEHDTVYLNIRPMSWSWATWRDRWNRVDWSVPGYADFIRSKTEIRRLNRGGSDLTDLLKLHMEQRVDSWYIRWVYHAYKTGLLTVYPTLSLVNNIGHDGTGVHCGQTTNPIYIHSELNENESLSMPHDLTLDSRVVKRFNRAFNIRLRSRVKARVKSLLGLSK